MFWRVFIVLKIDEECLVWLETVPAECIGLLDPTFFGADIFMPLKIYLSQLFHDKKMSHSKK